jgi:septum formation protein
MQRKIILASQSRQRFNLVKTLPLEIEVLPADIDEQAIPFSNASDKAARISQAKAEKIALDFPEAIVLAADTFALCEGKILEKPKTLNEARDMLRFLSGKTLTVMTGFAFIDAKNNKDRIGTEEVEVDFRELSETEIETYVNNEPVLTWSAAFSPAYDSGMALIKNVRGNFTAFSHGLPIDQLIDFLRSVEVLAK